MKKNRFAFILTLILIVVAVLLIWNKNYTSTIILKDADFAVQDTASITKIFIANLDTNQVLLERGTNGWTVNKINRAQQQKIDGMLNTMLKLRVRAPVSVASHDNVVSRMAGIAIKVEVYQIVPMINLFDRIKLFPREKRTKVYYVGDVTKDNMGTFMLKEGAKNAYIMYITGFKGFVMSRYSSLEDDWRDHQIFHAKLGEIKSVKVEFNEDPLQSYNVEKVDNNNFRISRLSDGNILTEYDTLRLLNFLTSFSDIRFEALLNNKMSQIKKDSIIQSPFLHRITLVDLHGETTEITTFLKKKYAEHLDIEERLIPVDLDRMYALVNEDRDFVLIQYFVFDKVLRPASYFVPGSTYVN
ncbi:MAG: hypothetical protein CVT92_10615 [Bacteroidetes bacterium HGW-Bacteroidetes-1]|jgi:hypothetical protein|nr:MAG: hypothetical protein CVT92_10615 [Bacteroidetes bacterium HGW-Bacteroidetes-1]